MLELVYILCVTLVIVSVISVIWLFVFVIKISNAMVKICVIQKSENYEQAINTAETDIGYVEKKKKKNAKEAEKSEIEKMKAQKIEQEKWDWEKL